MNMNDKAEIRNNGDGTVDEIVAEGKVHIEQMSDNNWWMAIYGENETLRITFNSRGKITCIAERCNG